jgi:RNA polymerase sigma-70 factor (ECF subfamily)
MDRENRLCPEGLYRRHSIVVYSYLRYHVHSRLDAEDLTAEVFESAIRGLSTFDPSRGSERAWLLGIAHSRLVRFRRTDSRRATVELEPDRVKSPYPGPQERLALSERKLELLTAVGTLAPRDRQVLTLRSLAELRASEVAGILGISRAHVAVVLHRARNRLKRLLNSTPDTQEEQHEHDSAIRDRRVDTHST